MADQSPSPDDRASLIALAMLLLEAVEAVRAVDRDGRMAARLAEIVAEAHVIVDRLELPASRSVPDLSC